MDSPPFLRTFTRLATAGTPARVYIALTSLQLTMQHHTMNFTKKTGGKADS
jgi:hypothetical protein